MFGFVRKGTAPPSLEVVGFNHRLLRFTCTVRLGLGDMMDLTLDVPGLGATRVSVTVVARDGDVYTAEVHADLPVRQHLFAQFGTTDAEADRTVAVPEQDRRCRPRFRTVCQVRSRGLPGYQALTWDLTPEGVRLQAREALPPGAALDLDLDLDDTEVGLLKLPARVIWSGPGEGGAWIGLQFTRGDANLARYLERKVYR